MLDHQKSTNSKRSIKSASKRDYFLIREIEQELNLNITSRKYYNTLIQYQNSKILKLIFLNQIVGFIQVQGDYLECEILSIGIKKKYQKKGLGKSLILFLIQFGYQNIFLEVCVNNFNAINFYFSLGFKIISIRKNYYKNGLAESRDAYLLKFENLQ